jgi:curved DNA-binding protein CbpA/TM2 domain-containing membrane protein YozV
MPTRSKSKSRTKEQAQTDMESSPPAPTWIIWCCSQTDTLHGEDIPWGNEDDPANRQKGRLKHIGVVFFIWLFFGLFGGHHFYLDRPVCGALYACSLGCFGLGWLYDFTRLRALVSEANRGESKHQPYQITVGTCCRNFCLIIFTLICLAFFVFTRGPYYIRKFDPLNCNFSDNPYETLGVPFGTSFKVCKKAYRSLAKELHPDHNPGCDQKCTDKMAKINLAFEKLKERDGASVVEDDIADQWQSIYDCLSSGGSTGDNQASRERQPYSSGNTWNGNRRRKKKKGKKTGSSDCSDVCYVGVCDSPADVVKGECSACADCMANGGHLGNKNGKGERGESGGINQNRGRGQKGKQKKKTKEFKRDQKSSSKSLPKKGRKQKKKISKDQSGDKQKTKLTPAKRYELLSAGIINVWFNGVRQVVLSQEDSSDVERFGSNENTILYFAWGYFLKLCGVSRSSRPKLSNTLFENQIDFNKLINCKFEESKRELNSESGRCEQILYSIDADPSDAVAILSSLNTYHHILSILSLSDINFTTLSTYAKNIHNVFQLSDGVWKESTAEERKLLPITDDELDVLTVSNSEHRKHLKTISNGIIKNGGGDIFSFFEDEL